VDDLYATLGVSRTASTDEIKKAYRKLARVHHPDANPDDPKAEERFKEISHAHDVLSDADKRREYDQLLAFGGRRPNGGPGGAGGPDMGGFGDFADLFSSIFRGGRAQEAQEPAARRGADVEVEVNLSFEQAMAGAQVPVQVETPVACADCGGSGAKPGTSPRLCPDCKGRGVRGRPAGDLQVVTRVAPSRLYTRTGDDLIVNVPVTFAEAALGARVEVPTLDGRVKLRVPPGSAEGRSLRIPGKGAPRLKGEGRGDLIAKLRVQVPREMSDEQRKALEAFAELDDRDPRETLFS
jgi:molecular chaperone DnaJ